MKVDHNCDTIYDGVVLQSYVLVFVNVVLLGIFQVIFSEVVMPSLITRVGWLGKYMDKWTSDIRMREQHKNKNANVDIELSVNPVLNDIDIAGGQTDNNATAAAATFNTANLEIHKDETKTGEIDNLNRNLPGFSEVVDIAKFDFEDWLQRRRVNKFLFLLVQAAFGFTSFALALRHSINNDHHKSTFIRYQNFYGLVMNSSMMTAFIACITYNMVIADNISNGDTDDAFGFLAHLPAHANLAIFIFLLLLPAIITHTGPAVYAYLWMAIIVFIVIVIIVYPITLIKKHYFDNHKWTVSEKTAHLLEETLSNVFYRVLLIIFFQTFYNYMALLYLYPEVPISGQHYMDVIAHEYRLRSQTACLFEHYNQNVQNSLVFFNWL